MLVDGSSFQLVLVSRSSENHLTYIMTPLFNATARGARANTGARTPLQFEPTFPARCGTLALAPASPRRLRHDLVHLAQARRADRLAVCEAAPVGVDRQAPVDQRWRRSARPLRPMVTSPHSAR